MLKKHLPIGLFAALTLTIGIYGCVKHTNGVKSTEPQPVVKTFSDQVQVRNPANDANPYDFAGQRHNSTLSGLKTYIIQHPQASDQEICQATNQLVHELYGETVTIDPNIVDQVVDNPNIQNNDPSFNAYQHQINQIIQTIPNVSGGDGYDQFKNAMVSLENTILNNSSLSQSTRQNLLMSASIARYSADFWWNVTPSAAASRAGAIQTDKNSLTIYPWPYPGSLDLAAAASAVRAVHNAWDWLFN